MNLSELVAVSTRVAATAARNEKVALLAELLGQLPPAELPIAVSYLSGELPQGRIGMGYRSLRSTLDGSEASGARTASVTEVDAALTAIAEDSGAGSQGRRRATLTALLARLSTEERTFVAQLLAGGLRQGALRGVMVSAVARASGARVGAVRRALMFSGRLGAVATAGTWRGRPHCSASASSCSARWSPCWRSQPLRRARRWSGWAAARSPSRPSWMAPGCRSTSRAGGWRSSPVGSTM